MSNNELAKKLKELRSLQIIIEEAQAEAEAIRDAIKLHMGETEEIRVGEYKVTWKPVKSARIDTAALRKAFPDVVRAFTCENITRRFCVV